MRRFEVGLLFKGRLRRLNYEVEPTSAISGDLFSSVNKPHFRTDGMHTLVRTHFVIMRHDPTSIELCIAFESHLSLRGDGSCNVPQMVKRTSSTADVRMNVCHDITFNWTHGRRKCSFAMQRFRLMLCAG